MDEKIRVIIADDHPILIEGLLHILLRRENIQIIGSANNGKRALQLIREYNPDIAILDVQMPDVDGFEVARLIIRENLPTKIIFLTMFMEKEFVDEVIALGIKGYVLKENAVIDIVNCIESVMQDEFFLSPKISNLIMNRSDKGRGNKLNENLTNTENKILKLIAKGKNSKEIADELFISAKTVNNHRSNICKKLGITGTSALLKYALKNFQTEN